MIQQNKTERAAIQNEEKQQNEQKNLNLDHEISQSNTSNPLHDQSRVQIVLPERRSTLGHQEQMKPLNLIDSEDGIELAKTPQIKFKQSERRQNAHDVSTVCIDLLSDNQVCERKCTLNSLHYSRVFNDLRKEEEIKKEEKFFIQLGIQTSGDLLLQKHSVHLKIEEKNSEVSSESKVQHKNQFQGPDKTIENQEIFKKEHDEGQNDQQIILLNQYPKQQLKIEITTEQNVQSTKIFLKQTLLEGIQTKNQDSQMKETAYMNSLQNSIPEIRNRKFTFQAIQETQKIQYNQSEALDEQIEDDDLKLFLEKVDEVEYDRIIKELGEKVVFLQSQLTQLLGDKGEINEEKLYENEFNEQNSKKIHQENKSKNLSIYNSYELSIQSPPKQQSSQKEVLNQQEQPSITKEVQISQRKSHLIRQFSSGEVSNLLVESETQLIDLRDLQGQQSQPVNQNNLQQMPVVFSSSLTQQISTQSHTPKFQLPILQSSQANLATIKESYEQLPYERFRNIMMLDQIVSKISFKEKHFPSSCSTEKELKLYGKRLLRLLVEQSLHSNNYSQQKSMLNIENDMEYYKSQQHIIYYLKSSQNFAFICYFNHTIYIGEYITQGPLKQITRQGYGIQIRDSKYIYQGEFFADKKHGQGFIQFIGKNPFIYYGYFLDGFMDGHGKSMNQNGEIYIGDYKLGQRDGVGRLIYNQQKDVYYEGEFYDGYKHGQGFQLFENGDSYKGFYLRDKFQGEGEYKWKNQTLYKGSFVDGYKHGPGFLIFPTGKSLEKYYDHNKEINLEDDKKTIKSSRISTFSHSKLEEKTLIQQKPRNFKNVRSVSGQSLFSYKSKSNQKSVKLIKDKKKIAELLREKQIEKDLKNLDKILKDPADQSKIRKIFSVKKIDNRDKIIGKMYNITERPSMKISEKGELDLFKLSKIGSQRKSLVNFDSEERLEELRDSTHNRRVQRTTNFSQF